MIVVRTAERLRAAVDEAKATSKSVGFVPTMGALHEGHLSLLKIAKRECDYVVVSIFVNPTQFGPSEDFERYPRTPERDCELLKSEGADLVYLPSREEMYGEGEQITVDPGPAGQKFEGRIRPTHFRGVLTVVAKFFAQVRPDVAVFGEKDAQQLFLVRRMVADLRMPLRVIAGPTLREADGLAMSSRNKYLKQTEREKASVLHCALVAGASAIESGERSLDAVRHRMRRVLDEVPEFEPDYCTALDNEGFAERDPVNAKPLLIVAGRLGSVRLIDNLRPSV